MRPMKRDTFFNILVAIQTIIWLALIIASVYVAAHFIIKFW